MSDRTTLKSYFETGDTPTQAEFADLIDSAALTTETITTSQANDIIANNAKNSYPTADATKLAGIEAGAEVNDVDSVNGEVGVVVLNTDDISEGSTNEYFTDAKVSANLDVVTNTAKNSYPSADATKLSGIEAGAEVNDTAAEIKTKYESNANTNAFTDSEKTNLGNQSGTNTGDQDISGISTNASAITTIQGEQTVQDAAIALNTAKNSYPSADATKLAGIETGAEVNTVDSVNGETGTVILDADDISDATTANKFVTTSEKTIISNTSGTNTGDQDLSGLQDTLVSGTNIKTVNSQDLLGSGNLTISGAVDSVNGETGVVVLDTDDIDEGSTNLYYTEARVSANTNVAANTAKNSYPSADATKLSGIESGAEVNDTASEIKTKYESNANTNAFTDAEKTNLGNQSGTNTGDQDLSGLQATLVSGTNIKTINTQSLLGSGNITISGGGGDVDSVNGETGVVVLDTDDISEGSTNLYYTESRVSANTDVVANTAKVGITTQQASDIISNNAKNSYPTSDSVKVGHISVTQAVDLDTLESNVTTNNSKVGITSQQAADIVTNNGKVSMVLGTTSGTALEGNTTLLQLGTTSTTALAGDTTTITTQQASDISTNNSKVGITTQQAADIVTNNAKVGITTSQANAIVTNTSDISSLDNDKAEKTNVLELDNTSTFTPNADYEPATKKYVDDSLVTPIGIACSDETTALNTGSALVTFRMPYAFNITEVRANVTTAPTGSAITVNINENGTTIFSTNLTIDAGEETSTTAATPPVIVDSILADDAKITIDIFSVGSTVAGAGLKVWIIGNKI